MMLKRSAPPANRPQRLPKVVQTKSLPAQNSKTAQAPRRPVAPAAYRPQPKPKVLLRKTVSGAISPNPRLMAQVYRPQGLPRVLQKKSATAAQAIQPHVYRPELKKVVQPKLSLPPRKTTPAPPAFQAKQRGIVQPETADKVTRRDSSASAPGVTQLTKTNQKNSLRGISDAHAKSDNRPRANRTANARHPNPPVRSGQIQRSLSQREQSRIVRGQTPKKSSVVQRARDMLPYSLNYVMLPDTNMSAYTQHVKMRTRHFFTVVIAAVFEMQKQGQTPHPAMFTDHAKAQEAKGYRLGSEAESKLDAAHLMNTTLVPSSFTQKNETVGHLYRASAATTTQFQKSNVGPDKIIDSQQTVTKNAMLSAIKGGTKVDKAFIGQYVADYLKSLSNDLKVELPEEEGVLSQSRAAAMRAIAEDLQNLEGVVCEIISELKI
jgi:hypothetical protein